MFKESIKYIFLNKSYYQINQKCSEQENLTEWDE